MSRTSDAINEDLRRQIQRKQKELVEAVASSLSENQTIRRAGQAAIRRIHKSIALRTSKLLCQHEIHIAKVNHHGAVITWFRCSRCKAAVRYRIP